MSGSRELVRGVQAERPISTILNVIGLRPRTALVAAALAIVTAGIAMNWSALVAAGIAPLIISALPCAVMCALGLCMSRMRSRSCAAGAQSQQPTAATAESLQLNSLAGRIAEPHIGNVSADARVLEVEARQAEEEQERRPINA